MANAEEDNQSLGDAKRPTQTGSDGSEPMGPGKRIGHFRIERELGHGGMGVVYLAQDTELDRLIAMKSLPAKLVTNPEALSRLQREARILGSLNHPSIATIYEKIEQTEGGCYLVLEYVPGETLAERIVRGKLDLTEALEIGLQIANALAAAHSKGIVHRDLNPKNVRITPEGHVKVLDFGLAEVTGWRGPDIGREGAIVGTPPYMSPEQVLGGATDYRTDIWSFGCLLYEMLTGICSHPENSTAEVFGSILAADVDLDKLPSQVPAGLRDIISKCLKQDREQRYRSTTQLFQDLQDCLSALTTSAIDLKALSRLLQKPHVAVTVGLVCVLLCTIGLWLYHRSERMRWARIEAVPEIIRLIEVQQYFAAFTLAREAEGYIPEDPVLNDLWLRLSRNSSIKTEPAGAEIFVSEYLDDEPEWLYLGCSPLRSIGVPFGANRWRIQKEGFGTVESVRVNRPALSWVDTDTEGQDSINFTLHQEGELPSGMVKIPSSELELRLSNLDAFANIDAPAYAVDKYEVTNAQFKEFVDNGGYSRPEYWEGSNFVKSGQALSWKQAMAEFRDRTGRPGPSTWEGGTYPEGQDYYPVSGVSWYEATAYARFKRKSLPTVYHWIKAARAEDDALRIVSYSNFNSGKGTALVGSHRGMGRFGLYGGAGNVREWCYNSTSDSGNLRYCLGGAWDDSPYMFITPEARSAWDRDKGNGLRCVHYLGKEREITETAFRPIVPKTRDFRNFKPVSGETLMSYMESFYQYERTDLNPVVELVDESAEHWRYEKITFDTAYSDERVIAHLLLPIGVEAPYQVVVFIPGASSFSEHSSERLLRESEMGFIVEDGRALLYPICQGMYERSNSVTRTRRFRRNQKSVDFRDMIIQISKDLRRSIDYLETRDDIDPGKLGYFGYSWGGLFGPIMLATEERFKAGIFFKSGFCACDRLPPADPANFAPRVRIPVLMINGSHDFIFPFKTGQKPLLDLLGTPKEDIRHVAFPGGHNLGWENRKKYQMEILDWLDQYLGPVN